MRLSNLRLPFAVEIHCWRGRCQVSEHCRSKPLIRGECIRMPEYRQFCLEFLPWTPTSESNAVHLSISDVIPKSASGQADVDGWSCDTDGHIKLRVARAVFADPDAAWSRNHAAGVLKIPVRSLSSKMLQEGAALMEIVREQRLMRALVDMIHNERARMHEKSSYGFCSLEQLQSEFYDRFGISLDRNAAERRHCAITWSGGNAFFAEQWLGSISKDAGRLARGR